MSQEVALMPEITREANYAGVDAGTFSELHRLKTQHPLWSKPVLEKLFIKELIGHPGMEVSFGAIHVGRGVNFYHRHTGNEELYIFVSGRGQMQVGGRGGALARLSRLTIRIDCPD